MKSDRLLLPPKALSAAATRFSAAGQRQTMSRCMPGYCAPCPGNNTASFSGAHDEKVTPSGVAHDLFAFCASRLVSAELMILSESCLSRSSTKVRRAASALLKAARERMAFMRIASQARPFQHFSSCFKTSASPPDSAAT